jgi:hypothetical protein
MQAIIVLKEVIKKPSIIHLNSLFYLIFDFIELKCEFGSLFFIYY